MQKYSQRLGAAGIAEWLPKSLLQLGAAGGNKLRALLAEPHSDTGTHRAGSLCIHIPSPPRIVPVGKMEPKVTANSGQSRGLEPGYGLQLCSSVDRESW